MRDTAEIVLGLLPADVQYADVRVVRRTHEQVLVEVDGPGEVGYDDSLGLGLRVVVGGHWGFAATYRLDPQGLDAVVRQAVGQARAAGGGGKVSLGQPVTTRDTWSSPMEVDPFTVALSTKLDLLAATVKEASTAGPLVQQIEASLDFYRDEKVFANTEGALIEQTLTESGGGLMVNAGNGDDLQRRSFPQGVPRQIRGQRGDFATAGFEHVLSLGLDQEAARIGSEAVALLSAPQCPDEITTLVASGNQLAMVLHECAGHPMEADRALGTEVSLAGGTYATPERRGTFRWGSPIVSAYADATIPGALGSFGYDDEGVRAQRTQLVKDGIFLGYMSGRESAAALGAESTGAARADGWQRLPLVRMTNICLEPGDSSLAEMIADTKHGVLVDTNRGFSIDDQRMSFRFATEVGWEIRDGKVGRLLKNCSYEGVTPQFWAGLDALGGPDEWKVHGVPSCNKGEPLQVAHVGHGTVPGRFRNVQVGR
ncbi:TldD protein [Kribbella sp. VKM Ac-2527]|uniref:TldD protein n=1 Tax=Kribbella caucasensis TaxID=2512215 RepID=A0A4R6K7R1_9ACTN|nr:TldD/PmbA family protein [Kribbella sp. VKM Ac-2527]TDO45703.1 TldD protein [Kribbella sp. VKM Ac-2527]